MTEDQAAVVAQITGTVINYASRCLSASAAAMAKDPAEMRETFGWCCYTAASAFDGLARGAAPDLMDDPNVGKTFRESADEIAARLYSDFDKAFPA